MMKNYVTIVIVINIIYVMSISSFSWGATEGGLQNPELVVVKKEEAQTQTNTALTSASASASAVTALPAVTTLTMPSCLSTTTSTLNAIKISEQLKEQVKEQEDKNFLDSLEIEDVIPIGIFKDEEDPTKDRDMILVKVKGLSYKNHLGKTEEWIPFYKSTGTFSGHPGRWFPFLGGIVRTVIGNSSGLVTIDEISLERGGSWIPKPAGDFHNKFNYVIQSKKYNDFASWRPSTKRPSEIMDEAIYSRTDKEIILNQVSRLLDDSITFSKDKSDIFLEFKKTKTKLQELTKEEINKAFGARTVFGRDLSQVSKRTADDFDKKIREYKALVIQDKPYLLKNLLKSTFWRKQIEKVKKDWLLPWFPEEF
ncbi:MAG: hypothetical protein HQK51_03050 [Oligoflexia bacterium]|nr:hypothetical protein [Oligoflexia bacterium]